MPQGKFDELNAEVIQCRRCPRLVAWREEIAQQKVRRFQNWDYWGRPVPGFGDSNAWLLIIGLAPAAHGANRTGRMFTGDDSGNWLYRALYETGFANQPTSTAANDGLELTGCYITATCRCAPPQNKVIPQEIRSCSSFLERELELLKNVRVILCLGRVAFDAFCRLEGLKGIEFGHNKIQPIRLSLRGRNDRSPSERPNGRAGNPEQSKHYLVSSYHPSRQNTQTGRLKWEDWLSVFTEIGKLQPEG